MEGADLQILAWVWIVLAIVFLVTEIFTTGFFIAIFGVGALLAGIAAFLGLGVVGQLVVFVLSSAFGLIVIRPFAERVSSKGSQGMAIDRVIGKRAVVLETIDPMANTGMVRMETEEWRAESVDNIVIPKGSVVEVVGVEGVRLQVRLPTQSTPP
jgi:membrane protein implicated in regulation of membrane protease activity